MKPEPVMTKMERLFTSAELLEIILLLIFCISLGIAIGGAFADSVYTLLSGTVLAAACHVLKFLVRRNASDINNL